MQRWSSLPHPIHRRTALRLPSSKQSAWSREGGGGDQQGREGGRGAGRQQATAAASSLLPKGGKYRNFQEEIQKYLGRNPKISGGNPHREGEGSGGSRPAANDSCGLLVPGGNTLKLPCLSSSLLRQFSDVRPILHKNLSSILDFLPPLTGGLCLSFPHFVREIYDFISYQNKLL